MDKYLDLLKQSDEQTKKSEQAIDKWAVENLTDEQYELEYQGLYFQDKVRYMYSKGGKI